MRKIKEKRMQSYVLRARKMVQEGKNKEGAEMLSEGLNYYSKNIIKALTPYATADAGIISMVLRNLADDIEKNNPGAKELRMWAENNTVKPELKETIKIKKPKTKSLKAMKKSTFCITVFLSCRSWSDVSKNGTDGYMRHSADFSEFANDCL